MKIDNGADSLTVLLVEDLEELRSLLALQLEALGYQTLSTSSAEQALAFLASHQEIDILITDIGLPGDISGVELVGTALQEHEDLSVVIMSGGSSSNPDDLVVRKSYTYLRKPFSLRQLGQALAESRIKSSAYS